MRLMQGFFYWKNITKDSFSRNISYDDKALQSWIGHALANSKNLRPALIAASEEVIANTKKRFSAQTAPDGSKWAGLKPATIKRKARYGIGSGKSKILVYQSKLLTKYYRSNISRNSVAVSTLPSAYAAVHQFGSLKQNIPARAYLGADSKTMGVIRDILGRHVS